MPLSSAQQSCATGSVQEPKDRAAASRQPHAPHQLDQAQSAAHQHNMPGGRAPGQ
ncbi:hypothetical protein [Streptomyces sp. NPDC058620]|uniref:hypothetical protein n=1 Tax=Streptomyces sp. NPDC058620 TaxID=3346560 RepID=UPI003653779F